tara:strand:+ start:100 stop:264 length:165 start_codon:yes stop_codon:yes gene_type:complete
MKQISVKLPDSLNAFWERKKEELKRRTNDDSIVTNSAMFESLVAFWKAMDSEKK